MKKKQPMKANFQMLVSKELYREALSLYAQCHASSLPPTHFTFPFLLKACAKLQSAQQTQQVHTHIIKTGFQTDIYTATALTDVYMKLQLHDDALKVFERIPHRNVPSFNAVISGFSQNGNFREALSTFRRLEIEGFLPNSVTVAGVLPACWTAEQGSQLHGLSIKSGYNSDEYVATALVTMYLNCGEMGSARRVFKLISGKKVVSYNVMISGLSWNGLSCEALDLFKEMIACSEERPNSSTLVSVLSLCSDLSALHSGKQIHSYYVKNKVGTNVMVGTALVDMYSKCGNWRWAYRVFTNLGERDLITWNSMISGLLSHGQFDAAVELFQRLEMEGLEPGMSTWNLMISGFSQKGNEVEAFRFFSMMQSAGVRNPNTKSITSLLQACSALSYLQYGKEIHAHAVRTGIDYEDDFFQTALVNMYMKCGCSLHARRIFYWTERSSYDAAIWNAMISGYGRNGENELALEIFRKMQEENIAPDSATFLSILSVCGHAGLVEKGCKLFRMMSRDYSLNPKAEHFGCIVDLLGRAGKLDAAWDLVKEIPTPTTSIYSSLLGACKCYSDARLGALIAERLSELDPGNPSPFVILSNIYAEQGRWNDVERLREMMIHRGLEKYPGWSRIGVR